MDDISQMMRSSFTIVDDAKKSEMKRLASAHLDVYYKIDADVMLDDCLKKMSEVHSVDHNALKTKDTYDVIIAVNEHDDAQSAFESQWRSKIGNLLALGNDIYVNDLKIKSEALVSFFFVITVILPIYLLADGIMDAVNFLKIFPVLLAGVGLSSLWGYKELKNHNDRKAHPLMLVKGIRKDYVFTEHDARMFRLAYDKGAEFFDEFTTMFFLKNNNEVEIRKSDCDTDSKRIAWEILNSEEYVDISMIQDSIDMERFDEVLAEIEMGNQSTHENKNNY